MFLALMLAGFLVLVLGFFLGNDHEVSGGMDNSVDQDGVIGIFSIKVIATFIMGFGAAGFVCSAQFHCSTMASCLWGAGSGIGLAAVMYFLLWFFSKQQGTSAYSLDSLINAEGTVSVGIDDNARGEVSVTVNDCLSSHMAVAKDGFAIAKGTFVRVVGVSGSELVVEKK